jgi:hypothetical protein
MRGFSAGKPVKIGLSHWKLTSPIGLQHCVALPRHCFKKRSDVVAAARWRHIPNLTLLTNRLTNCTYKKRMHVYSLSGTDSKLITFIASSVMADTHSQSLGARCSKQLYDHLIS